MIFINPLTLLVRRIALHKKASTVPTSIIPLSRIGKATVILDMDADADFVSMDVKKFFTEHDIQVQILNLQKWDINIFGMVKKAKMQEMYDWDADVFISLAGPENFTAEYASRCSRARFKIGRYDLQPDVYDIVIVNREHQLPRQQKVFSTIVEYLLKII
ncbi:MAG: hypothetical protein MJY91_04400 [Bacteroidales bacterium]|nr:hypothetical protein [Candidatus Cryptobacteroides choladohippi]MCQ2179327.1 hypothetical protein [Bacteroidales bacterium]